MSNYRIQMWDGFNRKVAGFLVSSFVCALEMIELELGERDNPYSVVRFDIDYLGEFVVRRNVQSL